MAGWRSGSAAPLHGEGHQFDPGTGHDAAAAAVNRRGPHHCGTHPPGAEWVG